ncbi:hypothetical protein TNCV_3944141 [Trichonephila clavipes]|nr:hypothetical protein TNCV_3944141 [Trichonephila clavipes]
MLAFVSLFIAYRLNPLETDDQYHLQALDSAETYVEQVYEESVGENNSTRPLNSKIKANAGEKQLNSSVGTKQLNRSRNETTQLGSRNETTQLVSRNETTQLRNETSRRPPTTACNRLQPPTTTCNRLQPLAPPTTTCTAYNHLQPPATAYNHLHRLQPPATACTAFTAESAFSDVFRQSMK